MARAIILLLLALFSTQVFADSSELQEIISSNSKFSRDFSKVLSSIPGNLVSSPLSAHLVLAMTQLGAGGNTASVMSKALHLPQNRTTSNEGFKQLIKTLQATNSESVKMNIANRIYLSTGFDVNKNFLSSTKDAFNSEPQVVDFVHPNTRNFINQWVEHMTQNKIKDLVAEGVLSRDTRVLLINALYFNGKWDQVFSRALKGTFYTSESNTMDVSMMSVHNVFNYQQSADLQSTLIEIPYMDKKLSLVILLPDSRTGLSELENKMQTQDLSSLINSGKPTGLQLLLPKFKIESTIDLKEPLKKMGMGNIFEQNADFSNINAVSKLKVAKVLQKTIIQVSENGTEAASATYVQVVTRTGPPKKHIIDHPFLFYLVHRISNSNHVVLFSGRVEQPQKYENLQINTFRKN